MEFSTKIAELKSELARLDEQFFETQKQVESIGKDVQEQAKSVNLDELPAEFQALWQKTQEEAQKAGMQRAEQAKQDMTEQAAPLNRAGALRI